MKQKIVIKLQMDCNKCRNKALKTAAEVPGVTSVALEGADNDCVAAIGVDVNIVCMLNHLKKKFCFVTVLYVEDLEKAAAEKKSRAEEEKKKKEEAEKKRKEEEEKWKKILCAAICKKCHSSSCHGECDKCCTKCLSINCDGECFIICVHCKSPKCDCECFIICVHCESPKCEGQCKPKPCPKPPSSCPERCNCPKCYVVPYQSYYYPYPPQPVCYYSCPDSACSIM